MKTYGLGKQINRKGGVIGRNPKRSDKVVVDPKHYKNAEDIDLLLGLLRFLVIIGTVVALGIAVCVLIAVML